MMLADVQVFQFRETDNSEMANLNPLVALYSLTTNRPGWKMKHLVADQWITCFKNDGSPSRKNKHLEEAWSGVTNPLVGEHPDLKVALMNPMPVSHAVRLKFVSGSYAKTAVNKKNELRELVTKSMTRRPNGDV